MIACPPFRMRIFIISHGVTSATNSAPTSSKAGRPAGKASSTTHWMKSSQNTGQASSMPNSSRVICRSRSRGGRARCGRPCAFGKATVSRTQAAKPASCAAARPATASRQTLPLCGTLSQDMHGEGRDPGGAAGLQAGEDQAEDGLRVVGVLRVGDDRRVLGVELAEWRGSRSSRPRSRSARRCGSRVAPARRRSPAPSIGGRKSVITPVTRAVETCRPTARPRSTASPGPASASRIFTS